jgi:hypothetical protein
LIKKIIKNKPKKTIKIKNSKIRKQHKNKLIKIKFLNLGSRKKKEKK